MASSTPPKSGFKISYQVQGQGVPRIENGAYTSVGEYFNSGDNAVPPKAGALDEVLKPSFNIMLYGALASCVAIEDRKRAAAAL